MKWCIVAKKKNIMGSRCSVPRRGKIHDSDQEDDEVSTIVKSEGKSSLLQRRPSLQEHHGAIEGTIDEKALGRQDETYSNSFMTHEHTTVEVNPRR